MENAKYHSRFIEHEEGWNDCFYVKARYWNSEYNSNKVGVIGENYLKKYWKIVCHWFYVGKSWLFCSTVVSVSFHIESHRNGMCVTWAFIHVIHQKL